MNNQPASAPSLAAMLPAIAFQRFILANGLTLLVHEDDRAAEVAVHIAYHVGAKNEPTGTFGLAHLLEHLMFSGSAALPGSYISHLERAGARGLNGVTNADMTQFFQAVPVGSLDFTLFAESDRMAYLQTVQLPQALQVQRDVVIREMEEKELQPLGAVQGAILRHLFPAEHPYAHKVVGERDDLRQLSLSRVQAWYSRFYRPNNAVITLAGRITASEALEKVSRWFGHITPGEPLEFCQRWVTELQQERRVTLQDRSNARLLRICWAIPPRGEESATALELFASLLEDRSRSLLVQRLMVDQPLASDISAFIEPGMLASYFNLRIVLPPAALAASVERLALQTLTEVLATEPDDEQLEHCQRQLLLRASAGWSDNLSLAAELGCQELYPARAEGLRQRIAQALTMSAHTVAETARRWLHQGRLVLTVEPYVAVASAGQNAQDRTPPAIIIPPMAPPVHSRRISLPNGLKVIVTPADNQDLLSASLIVEAGSQLEPPELSGVARLVAGMVATSSIKGEMIEQRLKGLDAGIELDVGIANIALRLQGAAQHAEAICLLLTDVLCSEPVSEEGFAIHRHHYLQTLAGLNAVTWALPALSFPAGHPLYRPAFTCGTAHSLSRLTSQDAHRFYRHYYRPQNSTLLLRSSLPPEQWEALLARTLARWRPATVNSELSSSLSAAQPAGSLLLIEHSDSATTTLSIFFMLPGRGSPHDAAVQLLHSLLATSFASRINFALREVDRLTYNVTPLRQELPGNRLLGFELTVTADNTLAAVRAICRECRDLLGPRPITREEMQSFIQKEQLRLGQTANNDYEALCQQEALLREGLAEDYWQQQFALLSSLSLPQIEQILRSFLLPERAKWILQGPVSHISSELETLLSIPAAFFPADPDALYQ